MDRRVKERLVGATILVALVVLIVPALLSGPKSADPAAPATADAVRSYTVDLAAPPAPAPAVPESASNAPAAAYTGTGSNTAAAPNMAPSSPKPPDAGAAPLTQPALESAKPAPTSNAAARLAAAGNSNHGAWSVQLGSFASEANAKKMVRELKSKGISAYVVSSGTGASMRHRVRVGPMADRDAAGREASALEAQGLSATPVAPSPLR
jgi:DedD protein